MTLKEMIISGLTSFDISCDPVVVEGLAFYIGELMRWNDRINLVGLKGVKPIVSELLCDALFLYGHVKESKRVLDLGSGSGILGIPLAILEPGMEVCSIDSALRKIQFQRHIRRSLALKRFTPIHGRIEDTSPLEADCIVVKAFGAIPLILEKGRAHLREGARALILKGQKEEGVDISGFNLERLVPYSLPGIKKSYRLFIYRKTPGSSIMDQQS
jgi:16S rRNA (guanine527-N7)-methyltransferase